jgi:hypothetical protein
MIELAMPPESIPSPQSLRLIGKQWPGRLLNVIIVGFALLGLLQWLACITDNDMLPPFHPLPANQAKLLKYRYLILTTHLRESDTPKAHWQALQPSLRLLQAINPDISHWITQLNRENRILWKPHATLFNWPVLASYDWRFNNFYLGPDFWKLQEGEKAAVLAHEYFHYRQNRFWMVADTLGEGLSGKLSEYGSRTEDEAHLYQWYAYQALHMPPSDLVKSYFSRRKLYRFVLTPPSGNNL